MTDDTTTADLKAIAAKAGMTLLTDPEMECFVAKMRAAIDAQTSEPEALPKVSLPFIPTAMWDEEPDPLMLITPEEYERVPDGAMLVSIHGKVAVKGQDDYIDLETRFGCTAWGFRKSQLGEPA